MASVNWNTVGKVLGSKGFETGAGIAGAAFSAASAAKNRAQDQKFQQQQLAQQNANSVANRAQSAAQNRSNTLMQLLQQQQGRRDQASRDVVSASPLGEMENFAGRQAFLRALAPQLRNFAVTPSDPAIAAAMPKLSGGLRLPEGGLPPEAMAHLSPEATASALSRRQKQLSSIDTSTPQVNLQALGIPPEIAQMEDQDVNAYIANLITERQEGDDRMQQQIMAALDADDAREQAEIAQAAQQGARLTAEDGTTLNPDGSVPKGYEFDKKTGQLKKKGSSIWKKIGKAAIIGGAAVATGLTAGAASPALVAAIGAGSGAALGAMDGGWKGALTGAALGGATAGLGGGIGGAGGGAIAGNTTAQVVKNALINPRTLTSMGSQFVPGTAGQVAQMGAGFLPGAPQLGANPNIPKGGTVQMAGIPGQRFTRRFS